MEKCRFLDSGRWLCGHPDAKVRIKKINWMMELQVAASWGERMALGEQIQIEEANVAAVPSAGKPNYYFEWTKCVLGEVGNDSCSHLKAPAKNLVGVVMNIIRDIRI